MTFCTVVSQQEFASCVQQNRTSGQRRDSSRLTRQRSGAAGWAQLNGGNKGINLLAPCVIRAVNKDNDNNNNIHM